MWLQGNFLEAVGKQITSDLAKDYIINYFSTSDHFFSANDTDVVCSGELLRCGIRVKCVHISDGAPGQDHIVESFVECPE
jgi:hypothetical protein